MLVIESLINHTSCLYKGTVALWETTRLPQFPCTVILFSVLVIFSIRSELHNRSIIKQLSNNMTFLISNLINLVWFCLNKTPSTIFQSFD